MLLILLALVPIALSLSYLRVFLCIVSPVVTMPIERRCDIVTGSEFFSPEEAQLILRHRKSSRSLAASCSDRGPSQVTRRLAKPSHKHDHTGPTWRLRILEKSENTHQFPGHVQDRPGGPNRIRYLPFPPRTRDHRALFTCPGAANRNIRKAKAHHGFVPRINENTRWSGKIRCGGTPPKSWKTLHMLANSIRKMASPPWK